MRTGIILSLAAHLMLWAFLAFANPRPFTGALPQAIEVAIVSASEASLPPLGDGTPPAPPAPEAPASPKAEIAPPPTTLGVAPNAVPAAPPPAAVPPPVRTATLTPPPPAEQSIPDPASLAEMLMLPTPQGAKSGFDGQAERSAKLTATDIAAFKAHVRSCAKLPDAVAADRSLTVVLRVAFKPDGALATKPTLVAGSPSQNGPALVAAAVAALTACQPYLVLPAAKYKEWKVLDVTLRPQDLAGG